MKEKKFYVVNGCVLSETMFNESYRNDNNDFEHYDWRTKQN